MITVKDDYNDDLNKIKNYGDYTIIYGKIICISLTTGYFVLNVYLIPCQQTLHSIQTCCFAALGEDQL